MFPDDPNADGCRMLRAALLASLVALLLPCAAAADAGLAGTWSGSYGCGGGSTAGIPFTLTLEDTGSGLVEGELRYDAPQAPGGTGAYRVRGRVGARDRSFVLVPAGWIDRPTGHTAVGLSGTLHDNGLTIEGDLRGCTAIGSRRFTAQRGGTGAPPATAGAPADEQIVSPTGGRFEGRWKGAVQCARPPELPLALTVLEDGGALAAVVTLGWPSGSGKTVKYIDQQMLLAGRATAAAGASLQRSIMLTRALFNELTGTLDASGRRMEGRIAGLPVSWRCETFRLERAGPPDVAVVKDAVAGTWAGYEVPGRSPADALSQVKALSLPTVMQVRIVLAGAGATLHGRYDVATPLKELPARQDRYAVGIRPLLRLDDGRVAFAPMAVQRAEGQFKDERRRTFASQPYLLAIAVDPTGTMTVDRLVGRIVASTGPTLRRVDEAERAALAAGEAPRVAFPGALGGALAGAPSLDGQCRVIRDWAQPVTAAGNIGQMTRTTALDVSLPLFTDATFEPVFGVPYSGTSQEERTALAHFMTWICAPRLGVEALRHTAITYPLMAQRNFDDVVARTVNRQESAGWLSEATTEIGKLPDDDDRSPPRLAALEAESRRRAQELGPDGRKRVAEAIAAKREAIAVAMVRKRAAAVPSLPDTTATIPTLRALLTDAGKVALAPDEAARLAQAVQGKAEAIVRPAVDAARAEARRAPATLDGLAALTHARRELGASITALGPQLQVAEAAEAARQLDARRATLIADPSIQAAFRRAMLAVPPGGDPVAAVERAALRYVDREHLDGGGPGRGYARAVREATDRLEIASIDFADRSTSKVPNEPSAKEMLLAIKARVDQLNDDLRSKYGRCQRREFQNDPLMAMECLTILGAGAGEQMRVRITRFEKIGCGDPTALTGFLCDYAVGIQSSSPAMQGRLGELMGSGQAARARFIRTTDGWLFRRLE